MCKFFYVGFISNAEIICCYLGESSNRNSPSTMNRQGLSNKGANLRLISLKHSSIVRLFSSNSKPDNSEFPLLSPWFITGFTDGERSFMIRFR